MSFPALVIKGGPGFTGGFTSVATGTPTNGSNAFDIGLPSSVVDPNWLDIIVTPNGPSVTGSTFVSLVGTTLTLSFTQVGADTATVEARIRHSIVR